MVRREYQNTHSNLESLDLSCSTQNLICSRTLAICTKMSLRHQDPPKVAVLEYGGEQCQVSRSSIVEREVDVSHAGREESR